MKVLHQQERIREAGASALFVVHDEPELVRETMLADLELPYPVLVDLERSAYAGWGLTRASALTIWGDPRVWLRYLSVVLHGQRPARFGADTLQLGGDFVVAADGRIAYARPQRSDDRPPVAELLRALSET